MADPARKHPEPKQLRYRAVQSVRLGPESFIPPPALDIETIRIADARADLRDRGE